MEVLQNEKYITMRQNSLCANDYRINMIIKNQIKGLLNLYISLVDGNADISYEVMSKHSLQELYKNKKAGYKEINKIIKSITGICSRVKKFLLNSVDIIFDMEYIFYDSLDDEIYFCYYPDDGRDAHSDIRKLIQEIILITDHTDRKAVELIYGVLNVCDSDDYYIDQIEDVLSNLELKGTEEYSDSDVTEKNYDLEYEEFEKVSENENIYSDMECDITDSKENEKPNFFNKMTRVLRGF